MKWLALIAMTVDHYGKIVDPSVHAETNAVGRLAFPLFAWIIGSRLAVDPGLAPRYLRHLLPWALLSQPVYVWVGKGWSDPNIFFTLAIGVALHLALHDRTTAGATASILLAVGGYLLLGADYGVFGPLIIPLVARLRASRPGLSPWALGPLGVLSNLIAHPPYVGPGAIWALGASAIAWLGDRWTLLPPRIPRFVFYAYYPLHLLTLHGLALIRGSA